MEGNYLWKETQQVGEGIARMESIYVLPDRPGNAVLICLTELWEKA